MEESITIKKNSVWKYGFFIILMIIGIGMFIFVNAIGGTENNPVTGNVINNNDGNTQKITLGVKDFNYYPNTITVKENQPVELTLDESVSGCLRSFTIKDLGVKGYSQNPSQTIDFTPTQKGSFKFSCIMGMGYGTLIVE